VDNVLGLARTGLIFTGLQEGAQLGRGVGADPTWPNRAGYSIPCAVRLGSGEGGAAVWVMRFVVVFSPYLYPCCSCFPLFAVLLNCPYPNPPVSACFFSFSSARRRGEGRPHGAFVACSSRNQNKLFTLKGRK